MNIDAAQRTIGPRAQAAPGDMTARLDEWGQVVVDGSSAAPEPTPGDAAFRRYASDLLYVAGVSAVSYLAASPDTLFLRMHSDEQAWVANAAIRDALAGAKVVFTRVDGSPISAPPADSGQWFMKPSAAVSVVAGLRGVHERWYEGQAGSIAFLTVGTAVSDHLRSLVEPQIGSWRTTFVPHIPRDPGAPPA